MMRQTGIFLIFLLLSGCGKSVPFSQLPKVDSDLVWEYAEKSVSFKERCSGSTSIAQYAEWIRQTASANSRFKVWIHPFEFQTPGGKILFKNIVAEIPGRSSKWILVGAHYDAKKFLTMPDFQAANDGASGVAALLGMIHALQNYKEDPPYGIRFVFFDGEECLYNYTENDGLHGSRAATEYWHNTKDLKQCRAMILLDMIGDKDLNLTLPQNCSPELVRVLKNCIARSMPDLRCTELVYAMTDDHVPFLKYGVPAIDLIDFEYGVNNNCWHTSGDTLENISRTSIKKIADLTFALIWELR